MYGFCYKGSKNCLANDIVDLFPEAETLYDLFAGGCAVSHCAIQRSKFKNVVASDVLGTAFLFQKMLAGDVPNIMEWLDKKDFDKRKREDLFVRFMWSFGYNGIDYLYGKNKAEWKKALHLAIACKDYSLLQEKFSISLRYLDALEDQSIENRYKQAKRTQPFIADFRLENLTRAFRVKRIAETKSSCTFVSMQKDYRDVKIASNSIIYCDIPYANTRPYTQTVRKSDAFDKEAFCEWALKQDNLVFISEYEMDDRFECIFQRNHRMRVGRGNSTIKERVFIPKKQKDLYLCCTSNNNVLK